MSLYFLWVKTQVIIDSQGEIEEAARYSAQIIQKKYLFGFLFHLTYFHIFTL